MDAGNKRSREFSDSPKEDFLWMATVSQDVLSNLVKALSELHQTNLVLEFGREGEEEHKLFVPWRVDQGLCVGSRGALHLLNLEVTEGMKPEDRIIAVDKTLLGEALKMLQRVETVVIYRAVATPNKLTLNATGKDCKTMMRVPLIEYTPDEVDDLGEIDCRWQFNVNTADIKDTLRHVNTGGSNGIMQLRVELGPETNGCTPAVLTFTNEDVEKTRTHFTSEVKTVLRRNNEALVSDTASARGMEVAYSGLKEVFERRYIVRELHKVLEKVTCPMVTLSLVRQDTNLFLVDVPIGASPLNDKDGDISGLTLVLGPQQED